MKNRRIGARSIHTNISQDEKFAQLVNNYGGNVGLFYFMLLPHVLDDAYLPEITPKSLKALVCPMFDYIDEFDVEEMLIILNNMGFLHWNKLGEEIIFNPRTFYYYNDKIPKERQRTQEQYPASIDVLEMPRRATTSSIQDKFDSVWRLVPSKYRKDWTMNIIKRTIKQYHWVSVYDLEASMIGVLEKFDGKIENIGTYFSNSVKWKFESQEPTVEEFSYSQWKDSYEELKEKAQVLVKDGGD